MSWHSSCFEGRFGGGSSITTSSSPWSTSGWNSASMSLSFGSSVSDVQCFGIKYCLFWLVTTWKTWFELSRVKLYRKCPAGKRKLLRVSGRFELSRVRVTEGKITVNVWQKSRGNRFWFELARGSSWRRRIRVIGSRLFLKFWGCGRLCT